MGDTAYSEIYTYNSTDGSLNTFQSAAGITLRMNYDGLRRLSGVTAGIVSKNYTYRDISETQTTTQVSLLNYPNIGSGLNFGYTYDSSGNIATYTAPDGEVITYTYDSQGQLLSAVGDSTYSYTYDAAGNILTANGHTYTYGDSEWKDLLTAFDNGEITYDASGNPTSYYNGTRWTMTWENGRQLISASTTSDTEDVTVTYVYDMNGLRVSKTVTVNTYVIHTHNYERIVEDPTCTTKGYIHYICDCGAKLGTTVVQPLGHDYVQTGTTTYVCTRCGDSTGNDLIVTPDPGGDDRFLRPTDEDVEDSLSVAAGTTSFTTSRILVSTEVKQHDYIYASGKLLREVITTGEGDTATTQILDFFYDSNGTPLALKTNDIVYYYVTNLQGDVIQLIDSTGTAVAAYEYDPYGNIVSHTGDLADTNPLRYRGYYYDSETGLYYVSSRYYDPEIGRWINADELVSTGQGSLGYNMFAYCLNNPVRYVDSEGREAVDACYDENPKDDTMPKPDGPPSVNQGPQATGSSSGSGNGYQAPKGGGGVSSSRTVGSTTVTFGHGGRHISGDISSIETFIANDVVNRPPSNVNASSVYTYYNGSRLKYSYRTLSPVLINVGTYFFVTAHS